MCFWCGSRATVKNGHKKSRQSYLCKGCGKQFYDRQAISADRLWHDYIFGKQSLAQLSHKYDLSVSTIRRRLKSKRPTRLISSEKRVVALMDATYWGWKFGVVVLKDARTKKILWRKFIRRKETLADYGEGVGWLVEHGFSVEGVVCDGLRGIFQLLSGYKVQMCQFHQVKIVQRYLTRKPELAASRELLDLVKMLAHTDKESFTGGLHGWAEKWDAFLKERSTDRRTGKTHYVHKRLRSAYLSLKRNMPYLWTWYDHIELGIPNTNNALEGKFTDLKTKLRNHNGLSKKTREIFIDEYFKKTFF